jgi:uncharacterized protein (DUF736 family)
MHQIRHLVLSQAPLFRPKGGGKEIGTGFRKMARQASEGINVLDRRTS